MIHINKLFLIFVNLILVTGCASNLTNNITQEEETLVIKKNEINYKFNKLPKEINVVIAGSSEDRSKDFLNGLLTNDFYYKKNSKYSPNIKFFTKHKLDTSNCQIFPESQGFYIVFLNDELLKDLDLNCLNKILKVQGLFINLIEGINVKGQNQKILTITRQEEYLGFLKYAKNLGNNNAIIIDDDETKDKEVIERLWVDIGGNVLGSSTSENKNNETLLSDLLLIQRSKERTRKLGRALSVALDSTPRRRADVDSIFFSGSITKARSLKPEVEYNFGESISVYMLPSWNKNDNYFSKELDLERVVLVDMPWMLNFKTNYIKNLPKDRRRSFALGFDSYEIALLLKNPNSSRKFKLSGMSGETTLQNGRLERKSLKVIVKEGFFEVLGY